MHEIKKQNRFKRKISKYNLSCNTLKSVKGVKYSLKFNYTFLSIASGRKKFVLKDIFEERKSFSILFYSVAQEKLHISPFKKKVLLQFLLDDEEKNNKEKIRKEETVIL